LNNLIKEEQDNINTHKNFFQKLKEIKDKNEKLKEKDKNDISSSVRINNNKSNKEILNSSIKQTNYSIDRDKIKNLVFYKENTLQKYHSTFCNFLLYKLSCDGKNNYYNIYHNFRIKIISEEHFIRSHLIIYNLLKEKKEKSNKPRKRYSYQINDLMNII